MMTLPPYDRTEVLHSPFIESLDKALGLVRRARQSGDHLTAFDLASQALVRFPDDAFLEYESIFALVNAHAYPLAETCLHRLEANGMLARAEGALATDFAGLRGRLLKERALHAAGARRHASAAAAAKAYQAVFVETGKAYPAVNAASLWALSGDIAQAREMATAALAQAASEPVDYWNLATVAEARLVLGDVAGSAEMYAKAASLAEGQFDRMASTRRQARWLLSALGIELDLHTLLPAPSILHWIADPALPSPPAGLAPQLAFGAVLSRADIVVAEAILKTGAYLELVLPCDKEACRRVLPPSWSDRLAAICERADAVVTVAREGNPLEETAGRLALNQARGSALLRAAALDALPRLVSLGADGRMCEQASTRAFALPEWHVADPLGRVPRALLFADAHGFSKLSERELLLFLEHMVGAFADVLAGLGSAVEYAETAGDGLYVVLSDVVAAARGALALQEVMQPARVAAMGLPTWLALRVSAHVGPVYRRLDRVIGKEKFCGSEVIRTARIEPVAPLGACYVTEQFAAALQCAAPGVFACDYVGRQAMAKGFGECRMYSLRRHLSML